LGAWSSAGPTCVFPAALAEGTGRVDCAITQLASPVESAKTVICVFITLSVKKFQLLVMEAWRMPTKPPDLPQLIP
jgi:hypothetical protein